MRLICLTALIFFAFVGPSEARRRRIPLAPVLKIELNGVLREANDLHTACVNQDDSAISVATSQLIASIGKTQAKINLAKDQKPHLEKILGAAKAQLELTQMSQGKDRKKNLQLAFNQIVSITRLYNLDNYRVFYCPKDKSTWIQRSSSPRNPVNPDRFARCGRLAR